MPIETSRREASLSKAEIEQLWFREAARRVAAMNEGIAKRIPADVVRREAEALLKLPNRS